jgi:HD-GYP domain-containing protein (c-di-GMP phosphodiesterase class II)
LAAKVAEEVGSQKDVREIFCAALLHDIGGIGYPFHITHYLQRHDKTSYNILLSHPIIGAQLVSRLPQMDNAAAFILDHHEWLNGQGYPRSKTKNTISWGSQIIRIADAVDIRLQTEQVRSVKDLSKNLSVNAEREFTQALLDCAGQMLGKKRFFERISHHSAIPALFRATQEEVGLLYIPDKIDAIGTTLEVISQIIDMKHPYSSGHSSRVSRYAMAIGLSMNLPHDEITYLKWAGLIHDIGKLNVERHVLNKRSKLTNREYRSIQQHARFTNEILRMLPSLQEVIPYAASHHEYYDGSGYPQGLKGEQIPIGARILCICDAFDAMTSNRPYRNPLDPAAACKEIKQLAGKQFDPELVKIAIPLFKNLGV